MDQRFVLGGVAIVLLATLVGVLALTGDEAETEPLVYEVSWPVEPGPAETRSDELQEGRNETYTFPLERPNVTRVSVELNWTDDTGEPDRFRVRAAPPNGSAVTNESTNGTIVLTFDVGDTPDLSNVTAENESQARREADSRSTLAGQGPWQVKVTLVEAPGRQPISEAPDLETEPDGSNSYELTFAHEAFRAELSDPRPPS